MRPHTAVFWDPRCERHTVPRGSPERPERVRNVVAHLDNRGWAMIEMGTPEAEAPDPLAEDYRRKYGRRIRRMDGQARPLTGAVHDPHYLARLLAEMAKVKEMEAEGKFPPPKAPKFDSEDCPLSPGTADAVWGAVETALVGGDHAMRIGGGNAVCVTRPPAHHCGRDRAMGFCYLNHVAILAHGLIEEHDCRRVAIVDFDVHHGNGTQALFEDRADVLYFSVHQDGHYPGTGAADERGVGDGEGTTVNVPLPAGSGDDAYRKVIDDELRPALRRFYPEIILVSAGFDAWKEDPLSDMAATAETFYNFGNMLAGTASTLCSGNMITILEGGYDSATLPHLINAYLNGAEGRYWLEFLDREKVHCRMDEWRKRNAKEKEAREAEEGEDRGE